MTAKVFKLDPLVFDLEQPGDVGQLPQLPAVRPRFWLPTLDENESPVDRLLDSLNFKSSPGFSSRKQSTQSPKGKEKEVLAVDDSPTQEDDRDAAFWIRASEEEPGPSNGRLFRVSSSHQHTDIHS